MYIIGSKLGKKLFQVDLPWGRLSLPGNPKKLGVPGIIFSHMENYEPHLQHHFARCEGAVLDIGANLGFWSVFVAACKAQQNDSSPVVAFEPVPENFRLLQENVRLSAHRSIVRIEQLALGATEGFISMAASNNDPGSCFVDRTVDAGAIRQIRLDDYEGLATIEKIGLIKIDVEGYEYEVLSGARGTIAKHKPGVLCEIIQAYLRRNGRKPADIFDYFKKLGYDGRLLLRDGPSIEPGFSGNGDYLFRPAIT